MEKIMSVPVISPAELAELFKVGIRIDLIDICTPVEYREVHIEGARNVPFYQLDPAGVMQSRSKPADEPLYLICRSGDRGRQACERFIEAGFSNVINVDGGTSACMEAGLPLVRGKKAVSLERQVRIAAGSFVLLGVLLGLLFHTAFFILPAFLGAGLIFAGITDTCAMGLLIARMPWNRREQPAASHCTILSPQGDPY
jgi:rhodanese-related sulfurtransferase